MKSNPEAGASLGSTSEPYRSPGVARQFFSQPGNIHMHVDGGGDPDLVLNVLKALEPSGAVGKVNVVLDSVGGPQRDIWPETYSSHTPGTPDGETFDYFATISLGSRQVAIRRVIEVINALANTEAIVIEVETVVARVDSGGALSWLPSAEDRGISSHDVGFVQAPTLPFEIHHGFDLPLDGPTLSLDVLLRETTRLGVVVGGWFRFARRDRLSYRSNSFSEAASVEAMVVREHALVNQFLKEARFRCETRTVVERVLGVWRTPIEAVTSHYEPPAS